MADFDSAPLSYNLEWLNTHLLHKFCVIDVFGSSYCNVGGESASQNHHFFPALLDTLCGDQGVVLLGYEVKNSQAIAFGDEAGFAFAFSGSTQPVVVDDVVPGASVLGYDLVNDVWNFSPGAGGSARPWADGDMPVRIPQRAGTHVLNYDNATNFIRLTSDDALIGDYLKDDKNLFVRTIFYADSLGHRFTVIPSESSAQNNSTPVGSNLIIDPLSYSEGIVGVDAPYGGTKAATFADNTHSPSLNITGTTDDESNKVNHMISFEWFVEDAQDEDGVIIYTSLSAGDMGTMDWASPDGDPIAGSAIGPSKGWTSDKGIMDLWQARKHLPNLVILFSGENDDQDSSQDVWSGEDHPEYEDHYKPGGGYFLTRKAQIERILGIFNTLEMNDARIIVIPEPANPRRSGSFDGNGGSTEGDNRYTTQALRDYEAVLAVNDSRVGFFNMVREIDSTFVDDEGVNTYISADNVHPTYAGQQLMWDALVAESTAVNVGPVLSNLRATEDSSGNIVVQFDSDERLLTASTNDLLGRVTDLSPSTTNLTAEDFTETYNNNGTYTYTATVTDFTTDGVLQNDTFAIVIDVAQDAEGNLANVPSIQWASGGGIMFLLDTYYRYKDEQGREHRSFVR